MDHIATQAIITILFVMRIKNFLSSVEFTTRLKQHKQKWHAMFHIVPIYSRPGLDASNFIPVQAWKLNFIKDCSKMTCFNS